MDPAGAAVCSCVAPKDPDEMGCGDKCINRSVLEPVSRASLICLTLLTIPTQQDDAVPLSPKILSVRRQVCLLLLSVPIAGDTLTVLGSADARTSPSTRGSGPRPKSFGSVAPSSFTTRVDLFRWLTPFLRPNLVQTGNRGFGLQALEPIPSGAFVIDYRASLRHHLKAACV